MRGAKFGVYNATLGNILLFLQGLLDNGRAFSTVKVYLAGLSGCHVSFIGKTVGAHPLGLDYDLCNLFCKEGAHPPDIVEKESTEAYYSRNVS